jgi:hypothetical protein
MVARHHGNVELCGNARREFSLRVGDGDDFASSFAFVRREMSLPRPGSSAKDRDTDFRS